MSSTTTTTNDNDDSECQRQNYLHNVRCTFCIGVITQAHSRTDARASSSTTTTTSSPHSPPLGISTQCVSSAYGALSHTNATMTTTTTTTKNGMPRARSLPRRLLVQMVWTITSCRLCECVQTHAHERTHETRTRVRMHTLEVGAVLAAKHDTYTNTRTIYHSTRTHKRIQCPSIYNIHICARFDQGVVENMNKIHENNIRVFPYDQNQHCMTGMRSTIADRFGDAFRS